MPCRACHVLCLWRRGAGRGSYRPVETATGGGEGGVCLGEAAELNVSYRSARAVTVCSD